MKIFNKVKRVLNLIITGILILVMLVLAGSIVANLDVVLSTKENIKYSYEGSEGMPDNIVRELKAFDGDCALVLGCGIKDENTPSPMLRDRLDVGVDLYKLGIVKKILLTGDNGSVWHNEIHVMLKYTQEKGVPKEDIFCDHAGFSTYDSMFRGKRVFGIKKAIIVTQSYHQYRSLYIAKTMGMEVIGVGSDQERYVGQVARDIREVLARNKDFIKTKLPIKEPTGTKHMGDTYDLKNSGVETHGE